MMNFDPLNQEKEAKGVFNNYVDLLVIKNFLAEQLYTRLKINKNVARNFINKLNSNEIIILNRTLNEYIEYIKESYENVNDYILSSSFNVLKKDYSVKQLQEKNKQTIQQNQEEQGEIISENIPRPTLEKAGLEAEEEAEEAEDVASEGATDMETRETNMLNRGAAADDASVLSDEEDIRSEEMKAMDFLEETVEQLKGKQGFRVDKLKNVLHGEVINNDPNSLIKSSKSQRGLDEGFKEQVKTVLNNTNADNKEEAREKLQYRVINKFLNSKKIPDDI